MDPQLVASIGLVPLPFVLALILLAALPGRHQPRMGTVAFIYTILVLTIYKTL